MSLVIRELRPGDEALVERFYRGIYLEAFAAQREPLAAWLAGLRGEAPYQMFVRLALAADAIVGGVTYELYPRSRCGLVTYVVVAPDARAGGLGRMLFDGASAALYAAGARAVLAEVNDPRAHGEAARPRLERFVRWGARVAAVPYVQPALGAGLERDRGLCLLVLPPVPEVAGETVRAFIAELYAATEGAREDAPPDAELAALLSAIPGGAVAWRD